MAPLRRLPLGLGLHDVGRPRHVGRTHRGATRGAQMMTSLQRVASPRDTA